MVSRYEAARCTKAASSGVAARALTDTRAYGICRSSVTDATQAETRTAEALALARIAKRAFSVRVTGLKAAPSRGGWCAAIS